MSRVQRHGSACWHALLLVALMSATQRGQASTSADPAPRDAQQQAADALLPAQDALQQAPACGSAAGDADQSMATDGGGAASLPTTPTDPALSPQPAPAAAGSHPGQPAMLEQAQQRGGAAPGSPATAEASGQGAGATATTGQQAEAAGTHPESQGADEAAGAGPQPPSQAQQPASGQPAVEAAAEGAVALDEQQQNFALAKDGAKVLATNKEAKKAPALLDDDSDTFLKNDCRADKWVMLELSQVARVSRLELSQFELYSARVREFEAWGRQSHPRTDGHGSEYARTLNSSQWQLLGNFTAEKAKGSQTFALERPQWMRYLLLRFLSQHGAEPVCAVNGISVYGKSAAEELEDQLASAAEGLGLGLPEDLHEGQQATAPAVEAAPAPAPHSAPQPGVEPGARDPAADAAAAEPGGAGPAPSQQLQQQPAAGQQPAAHASHPPEGAVGEPVAAAAASNGSASEPPRVGANQHAAEEAPSHAPAAADAVQPQAGAVPPSGNVSSDSTGGGVNLGTEQGRDPDGEQGDPASQLQAAAAARDGPAPAAPPGEPDSRSSGVPASKHQAADVATKDVAAAATPDAAAAPEEAAGSAPRDEGSSGAAATAEATAPPPASLQPEAPPAAAPSPGSDPGSQHAAATHAASPSPPAGPPLLDALELPLAGLGPKGKGGGSVYELLVQEIKTTKLQQKLLARSVLELQRNASAQHADLAADVASLAASLAKLPADLNMSGDELAARVDLLVEARLLHVSAQMLALQAALASSAKQQHALLCFLAMLGGVLGLSATRFHEQWPRAKYAVLALAAANGLVGVVLQLQGGIPRGPVWLQALPWEPASKGAA